MNIVKKTALILSLILVLAALLRLPLLDKLPSGITIDEAGQAYSAYSILKTGKDEWGDFMPLNPRAFGDYKPPVFMYLLVPSIAVFGLNEFAVRLPSAIAGILTVWVVYFLVRDSFKSPKLGLLSSLFMAISPWQVYYSRIGWESNVGLLFFTLGIWLFLKGLANGRLLALSVFSFGLAGMSYHSFKLLVPLMVTGLIIIFWKQLKEISRRSIILAVSVSLVFVLILGYGFIFSGASRRAADQSIIKEENLSSLRDNQVQDGLPQPLNRIVYNKYQFLISKVADNYLGYFSFDFLFGPHRSDGSVLNFPSMGLLYIWQLPLILLGIVYLLKNKSKDGKLLFLWAILAPIPASLTQDYMHAGRAQALFPALTIISAIGLYFVFNLLKSSKYQKTLLPLIILIIVFSVFWRIDNYLFHTFNRPLGGLVQGYKETINFTESRKDQYDSIIFTKGNSEPQAFVGFFAKTDPKDFQKSAKDWKHFEEDGFKFLDMTDYRLGKYEFRNIDFSKDRHEQNALIITTEKEMPSLVVPKYQFKDSTGKIIFAAYDTNEIPN